MAVAAAVTRGVSTTARQLRLNARKLTERMPAAEQEKPRFVEWGTGCALLLGETALRELGELDEGFWFYGEDSDYSLRAGEAGGRVLHVPSALVLHRVSDALGGASPHKAYLKSRSHVRLLGRHWSKRDWPVLIPAQVLYYAALSAWHLFGGRWETALAALRGVLDELRGAPSAA